MLTRASHQKAGPQSHGGSEVVAIAERLRVGGGNQPFGGGTDRGPQLRVLPHDLSLPPRRQSELVQDVEDHDRGRHLDDGDQLPDGMVGRSALVHEVIAGVRRPLRPMIDIR